MKNTLQWQHFPTDERGFFRAPVLVHGSNQSLLVDGGFNFSDARIVSDAITATGTQLSAIYVTQSDPDYYFGLLRIAEAHPDAEILASPEVVEAIEASVDKKLATWGPNLGDNGPQTRADLRLPTPTRQSSFEIDGRDVEVVSVENMHNRRYLWVPELRAVFGGVLTFAGVHVWTADTATPAERAAWLEALDSLEARKPAIVVPGHGLQDSPTDGSSITYTRDYLRAFEEELSAAADSASLIAAMQKRYPDAEMGVALDVGAKVATGEMQWG